jgi:hypothetical protein
MDKKLLVFYAKHYNDFLQYYGTRENYDYLTSFFLARLDFSDFKAMSSSEKINFVLDNKIFLSSKFLMAQKEFIDTLPDEDRKLISQISYLNDDTLDIEVIRVNYQGFEDIEKILSKPKVSKSLLINKLNNYKNRIVDIFDLAPKLDREIVVYRGFQIENHYIVNEIMKLVPGKEINIDRFMSTTFNVKVIDMFSDEYRNGMIIKLKPGTKCLFVELTRLGYLIELIIAPAKYKFIKTYESRGRFYYVLEFLEHIDFGQYIT